MNLENEILTLSVRLGGNFDLAEVLLAAFAPDDKELCLQLGGLLRKAFVEEKSFVQSVPGIGNFALVRATMQRPIAREILKSVGISSGSSSEVRMLLPLRRYNPMGRRAVVQLRFWSQGFNCGAKPAPVAVHINALPRAMWGSVLSRLGLENLAPADLIAADMSDRTFWVDLKRRSRCVVPRTEAGREISIRFPKHVNYGLLESGELRVEGSKMQRARKLQDRRERHATGS